MRKILFFLRELEAGDIDWIIATSDKMTLTKGTVLINEERYVQALYILCRGKLTVASSPHPELPITTLSVGDLVGELSFLDARPPNATVTAVTDSVVLALPKTKIEDKLTHDLGFAVRFYRALGVLVAARLRRTVHLLSQYGDHGEVEELDERSEGDVALAEQWFDFLIRRVESG